MRLAAIAEASPMPGFTLVTTFTLALDCAARRVLQGRAKYDLAVREGQVLNSTGVCRLSGGPDPAVPDQISI